MCLANSIFLLISFCHQFKKIKILVQVLNMVFGLIWFIIGGIILFRSNISCIRNGTAYVIYALVLWCLTVCGCLIPKYNKEVTHEVHKEFFYGGFNYQEITISH